MLRILDCDFYSNQFQILITKNFLQQSKTMMVALSCQSMEKWHRYGRNDWPKKTLWTNYITTWLCLWFNVGNYILVVLLVVFLLLFALRNGFYKQNMLPKIHRMSNIIECHYYLYRIRIYMGNNNELTPVAS